MKKLAAKLWGKVTWTNAKFLIRTNVQSWVMQAAVTGTLSLVGVDSLYALVSAKVSSWAVFVWQCVRAYKN